MSRKRQQQRRPARARRPRFDPAVIPGAEAMKIYEATRLMLQETREPLGWPDVIDALLAFAREEKLTALTNIPQAGLSAMFIIAWASRAAVLELERALLTTEGLPAVTLEPGFIEVICCGVVVHYTETCTRIVTMLRDQGWTPGQRLQ